MTEILAPAEVGALIGVSRAAVTTYLRRYATTSTPFPTPDGWLGRSPYWRADRAEEIRTWAATRPGRTGRPRKRTP